MLLFCSSRKGCESTARHVSRFLKKYSIDMRKVDCDYENASSALQALRRCPAGLDPVLEETVPCGVAYHHAGLTVFLPVIFISFSDDIFHSHIFLFC